MSSLPLPVATDRIRLRQLETSDAADLRRIVTRPEVGRMLFVFPPDWTDEAAEHFIAGCRQTDRRPFRLAIAGADGRLLGSVGVAAGDEPDIFYFLDPDASGRGLMTEALCAFVDLLAAHLPLKALRADVFDDNPASMRILERQGFERVGQGIGTSAARLEPAAVFLYRLKLQDRKAAT
ncbi:GNAT family N-acetyltransferase [Rhodobacter sp. NSM]|uniref:GNAT family N-acetyltransferase n=1 Tax=Rhodobacter sp. NSM TaxID=3457501 RepID=UPI003FD6B03C